MAVVQLAPVQAPTREPLRGTLLDAATVIDGAPIGYLRESNLYESWACMTLNPMTDPCVDPPAAKKFDSPDWPQSAFFTVQGGATCKGPGFIYDDGLPQAQAAFLGLESGGVEASLLKGLFGDAQVLNGAALPLVDAVGLLEAWAANRYSGVPTLHVPRNYAIGMCKDGALNTTGTPWRLCTGTKVAAGAGYYDPYSDDQMIYMTGEVTVLRGAISAVPAFDTSTNDMMFLVERSYMVSVDCLLLAAKVSGKIECVCDGGGSGPGPVRNIDVACEPDDANPMKVRATATVTNA